MSTERTTRLTALTALATSALALGISLASAGCERDASAHPKQSAPPATEAQAPDSEASETNAASKQEQTAKGSDGEDAAKSGDDAAANAAKGKESGGDPAQPDDEKTATGLKVKRLVVTNAIEKREPVTVSSLTTAKKVVAFVEFANEGAADEQVVITFEQEGREPVGHVELGVPAKQSRWRTWGQSRMVNQAGEWEAVVSTPDGAELARQEFTVVEG